MFFQGNAFFHKKNCGQRTRQEHDFFHCFVFSLFWNVSFFGLFICWSRSKTLVFPYEIFGWEILEFRSCSCFPFFIFSFFYFFMFRSFYFSRFFMFSQPSVFPHEIYGWEILEFRDVPFSLFSICSFVHFSGLLIFRGFHFWVSK